MITLKQMHYFDALARALHFGKAASAVNISQPALSAQIMDMEGRLQRKLVERRRGKVVLTEAGQHLLPRIRSILGDVQGLEEMLLKDRGLLAGRLRIGMIPTIAPYLLPKLIPRLQAEYPKLEPKVRETITETLVGELIDGTLDVVVAAEPIGDPGLHVEHLFRDRFFIASSANSADVLSSPLNQDQVVVERLLLLDEGHCLRDQALSVCGPETERRLVNFGATSMTTLLEMVAHGMGLTLLPEIAIASVRANLRSIAITPFADPMPHRDIALYWRKTTERRGDFEAFANLLRATAFELLDGETGAPLSPKGEGTGAHSDTFAD
ncbi:hydrogen peroxide-inducible genes activator [Oricola cellulosilytica]|uniref:Hydrogen peroxide-inducible genes activator n=1 Tax=Oricola cellulosilytica TaxID=1429082 RepID=A0A4R0PAJ9_9HYPH|nr:hydrogen peroxide-inducible genes activator [Oricola cellulosilytica]TCD13315.1 hydrogen peroxide-inducible genes activator [Oricola cellulosilytica]